MRNRNRHKLITKHNHANMTDFGFFFWGGLLYPHV